MWFFFFAFSWRNRSWWAMASLLWKLHDYTQSHHTPWYSSGRVISSSQRPLPDNTQHSQHRHIFMPRWESNPQSQQGSGHIPHGRWDQHSTATQLLTWKTQIYIYIYIYCDVQGCLVCELQSVFSRFVKEYISQNSSCWEMFCVLLLLDENIRSEKAREYRLDFAAAGRLLLFGL